ncbi:hypothetical protein LEP1GSC126_2101 [Leptospira kirschneri str. 200801774]|nr:hypothetical protein LEP1GSC126_2101 [Leptospira kirschneri str. 200801774]
MRTRRKKNEKEFFKSMSSYSLGFVRKIVICGSSHSFLILRFLLL